MKNIEDLSELINETLSYFREQQNEEEVDMTKYSEHMSFAFVVAKRLDAYGQEGLNHLRNNGFTINETVLMRDSQEAVSNAVSSVLDKKECDLRAIKHAIRLLSSYQQINELEVEVEKYRRLNVVDEALKLSGR